MRSYVVEHRGGLLGALDYAGADVTHDDFVHMTSITQVAGIGFDEVKLGMATAAATVMDTCVIDYQPGPD